MGAPRRVALALLALPFELLALGVVAVALPLLLSLPRLDGTVAVTGLREPILVERDAFGIPTIRAANERDLYFGLGFVHAQDRLWQMEFHRRLGQGRLAEILGPAALPSDRLMRTLGLYRRA
ncbi:MAG TPA: penicillin acylase family protein, partial [Rhodospirillales bacterium]|nr:penicillin acylase family protein [Rhodospirillales bacterium]